MGLFSAATVEFVKGLASFSVVGGMALAVANYTGLRPVVIREFQTVQQEIDELSKAQLYIQFVWLQEKAKRERLSLEDQVKMCQLNKILDLRLSLPGCG